jgi:hypothetical protein
MNREIKFQFWNRETHEMLTWEDVLVEELDGVGVYFNWPQRYTPREYTGRVDKNKREVYEGDIVDLHGHRGVIVWDFPVDGWRLSMHHQMLMTDQEMVVIGNRWETPHLLSSEENA